MKKRIITAVAVFGLLGVILYFAYAQTAAQNNVKHFTAFFAVEGEAIDQNNDMKKEVTQAIESFHIPSWQEIPEIGLYLRNIGVYYLWRYFIQFPWKMCLADMQKNSLMKKCVLSLNK